MPNVITKKKLSTCEKWLVAFTFICWTAWAVDCVLCLGIFAFLLFATVQYRVLCALVVIGFSGFALRAVAYLRTRTLSCACVTGRWHCTATVLAAAFWTLFGAFMLLVFGKMIYYSMQVSSWWELKEVVPINMAFITPALTAVYFILLARLRIGNRRNGKLKDQIHE